MKLTTKSTIKIFLVIALFASAGFADDGHMPGGGFANQGTTTICSEEGQMPGGGLICEQTETNSDDGHMPGGGRPALSNQTASKDTVLNFVRKYLSLMFG